MTVVKWIAGVIAFTLVVVLLMMWSFGLELFGLQLGKHVENARTGVTRETNQYVTTQQQLLAQYAKEYRAAEEDGSTGQMSLIANQMNGIAITLSEEYVSAPVALILSENGY